MTVVDFAAWQEKRPPRPLPRMDTPSAGVWIRQTVSYAPDLDWPAKVGGVWHLASGRLIAHPSLPYRHVGTRCGQGAILIDYGPPPWTIGSSVRAWCRWQGESDPSGRRCGRCQRIES